MQILYNIIHIGLSQPFEVLHVSDTHITDVDERDNGRKQKLAVDRKQIFLDNEENLAFTIAYSKEKGLPIMHTGDLIDFVSHANLDRAKAFASETDLFFAVGNHEFSLYVGEAFEDLPYKMQSYKEVQNCFGNDIGFAVREFGNVQFVAIDNSYYLFYEQHVRKLREVLEKGKPVVLMFHTPLYEKHLYRESMEVKKNTCAYLCGTPEEKMKGYSEYRFRQQCPDDLTLETMKMIKNSPAVKAILTGHLHFNFESEVAEGIPQLVTGLGTLRHIRFE
ncbi:MAG: metallophosphoesterase [Clostridia bacterium]|nr:metallophosphoesterase [Clostridia bacterium]